jgi:hemoglobin
MDITFNLGEEKIMKNTVLKTIQMVVLVAVFPVLAFACGDQGPSVEEKMTGLEAMCTESADARTARHEEKSLYERLGGYERIHTLTKEIVRLHEQNEDFRLMMAYVDSDRLAKSVADFMAAGTGGTAEYKGRNMKAAHAHLQFTQADFLSAGGDVIQAMKNLNYGQEEIDEVVCILVSMKDQVVYK